MAKILFAWELGKGFGHLSRYLELIRRLKKEKHKIYFAARDVGNAERVFGKESITILQAPINPVKVDDPIEVPLTHAHVLHNIGFNDPTLLTGRIKAWQEIYNFLKPDLVIYDHSPTAQLAMRHTKIREILCGTGFTVPPAKVPMPNMRSWEKVDESKLLQVENNIRERVNLALKGMKLPELANCAELMHANATILMSFKELDHYGPREDVEYVGIPLPEDYGETPIWPAGGKKKVFAYLYPFKTLPALLNTLNHSDTSTIIYAPEVPRAIKNKHVSSCLKFTDKPLRIIEATTQCDLAITSGTHATTGAVLLAGKPILLLPQNTERFLVSLRVREIGAGLIAPQLKPVGMATKFNRLLEEGEFRQKANEFMTKYADFDRKKQIDRLLEIIETTLA